MTNKQHPITPPPNLVEQWWDAVPGTFTYLADEMQLATAAARWGANQELDACCEWVESNFGQLPTHNLRQFRRPKPPSLKEQALEALNQMDEPLGVVTARRASIIRRALEQLND